MSCSVFSTTLSLMQIFNDKIGGYKEDIKNDHMVWLEEIQQEANCMFSSEFSAEPELMPKTPSQKRSTRRKRVSLGRDASQAKRRVPKRLLARVTSLDLISEDAPDSPASEVLAEEPKRNTRRNKQAQAKEHARPPARGGRKAAQNSVPDGEEPESAVSSAPSTSHTPPTSHAPPQIQILEAAVEITASDRESAELRLSNGSPPPASSTSLAPCPVPMLEAVVRISAGERKSADELVAPVPSPGRSATKIAIAGSAASRASRRSSVRHSLAARRSLAGLRHSMTRESMRRASRRSFLKKKARMNSSTCSSSVSDVVADDGDDEEEEEEVVVEEEEEEKAEGLSEQPADAEVPSDLPEAPEAPPDIEEKNPVGRLTRSRAQNTPVMAAPASIINKDNRGTADSGSDGSGQKPLSNSTSSLRTRPTAKRKAADATEVKKASPPKKSQTERERLKLEALLKKQEQEKERKRKMEEGKKKKQEELKRKRDERLRKVVEARIKEEQGEEEKKKKIEQKMAQIDEKNDKLRVERLAEEKAKKVASTKRLSSWRNLEEEAQRRKIQQAEEEKRVQEEQQARRRQAAEACRAQELKWTAFIYELKKKQEREQERERQAAAEREREEREKALALQREAEKALREKERRELEALREKERRELDEWRKREEEQQKRAEEERAARLKEAVRQKEKEAAAAYVKHSVKKTPALNITFELLKKSKQTEEDMLYGTAVRTPSKRRLAGTPTPGKARKLNTTSSTASNSTLRSALGGTICPSPARPPLSASRLGSGLRASGRGRIPRTLDRNKENVSHVGGAAPAAARLLASPHPNISITSVASTYSEFAREISRAKLHVKTGHLNSTVTHL